MNVFKLLVRNLIHYKKEHFLLFAGMVLSTAILTSALIIGDSVKFSLNSIVTKRLGDTRHVISTQDKFFPVSFSQTLSEELNTRTAPVLLLRGMASSDNSETRLPDVQVCGVDSNFWKAGNTTMPALADNEVIINSKTSEALKLKAGDEIFIRIEKTSFVSGNAPFIPDEDNSMAMRLKVKDVAGEHEFGNFNVRTNQITPYNVFFQLKRLSKLNFGGEFANLMLIAENEKTVGDLNAAIKKRWTLDVINLNLKTIGSQDKIELNSGKVFIEDTVLNILQQNNLNPQPVFTYLVNFIRANGRYTPYSFVSALSEYPGQQLRNNEIIVNLWLAEDLGVKVNDTVQLQYFTLGPFRKLQEQTKDFIVKSIVGITGFAADSLLMPAFEGLAGVDRCSDWQAGIPVDFSKIRDKDETWWKRHKGTPKAFISYPKAVDMWAKGLGNCTSIRFDANADTTKIKQAILNGLHPSNAGLNVYDIKTESGWSVSNAVDFAGLFLALSFFLIVAAFLLSGLLFAMLVSGRRKEQGIYLSMGLPRKLISRIFFGEGLANALLSSIIGIVAGILLSHLVLYFLNSIWFDIVRTSSIQLSVTPATLCMGFAGNIIIAVIVIKQILKSHFKKQIGELNKNTGKMGNARAMRINRWLGISTAAIFVCVVIYSLANDFYQNSSLFFVAGFLLLVSLTSGFAFAILKYKNSSLHTMSLANLALRNLGYDFKRNITITTILSIGFFIVISTGANRVDFNRTGEKNSSGTGGFSFFVETNIGVNADLTTAEGREKMGIDGQYTGLEFVQMLRLESDDASCLNLNRVIRPSVLGVKPSILSKRQSFSFVKTIPANLPDPWNVLDQNLGTNCIPAVADQTVITWSLGKSVGDSILYTNERGEPIYLVLVGGLENSIFQGNVIISEENFVRNFPSLSGSNVMLADINHEQSEELKENLEGALRNYGATIGSAPGRLATFNSVTNTYLDIFLALGGIALVLGTFGIAIVLVRSIQARENQYAMMQAYGISPGNIRRIITIEFMIILFAGTAIGLVSAIVSSLQGLLAASAEVPYLLLLSIVILFTINGFTWIYLGSQMSVKKDFRNGLRNE